jgi:hypothetical protein
MNKELKLEAMDILKSKWSHLYMFGYPKRPFPTNYENDLNNVIIGLTSKYVEKQKLEFAIQQLKSVSLGLSDANTVTVYNLLQKIKELEQQLKQYDKEI